MLSIPGHRRISPKVRRLLREHDLDHGSVTGTGTDGRVTPRDVLLASRRPGAAPGSRVLASPLARRMLRDAGVDLADAARMAGRGRLTRTNAERVIGELATSSGNSSAGSGPQPAATNVIDQDVDVSLLLSQFAQMQSDFAVHQGFQLGLEVAVASATAAVLAARSDLAAVRRAVDRQSDAGEGTASVRVGLVADGPGGRTVAIVPDAQYLTVAGLARRGLTADRLPLDDETATPSVVVTTEAQEPSNGLVANAGLGWITVGQPSPRAVTSIDHLGTEVIHNQPHATLRFHHAGLQPDAAADLLGAVASAIASWALPVGP